MGHMIGFWFEVCFPLLCPQLLNDYFISFLCIEFEQVLVHGEQNEMGRLMAAILREYEDDDEYNIQVHNPKTTQAVELYFRGEKMAKVGIVSNWQ